MEIVQLAIRIDIGYTTYIDIEAQSIGFDKVGPFLNCARINSVTRGLSSAAVSRLAFDSDAARDLLLLDDPSCAAVRKLLAYLHIKMVY